MKAKHEVLLAIDGVVNLVLGLCLLLFPAGIQTLFGLPSTDTFFYASILGVVILGIGIALLLELRGYERGIRGLGLGGALVINFIGAGALVVWLLFGHFNIPLRGHLILWTVAVVVLGIGFVETVAATWKYDK
jgi:hypothetical protein